MKIKSLEEIELMTIASMLCSKAIANIAAELKPGMSSLAINRLVDEFIRDNKAVPSFLNYNGFPFAICASTNEAIVHGLPNSRPLQEGDILSLDIGVLKNEYHGDQAYTFCIGECKAEVMNLVNSTKLALEQGIQQAVVGNRIGDIGYAIEYFIRTNNYNVIKDFSGHAIGKKLHEEPFIPNFGTKGKGKLLKENAVFAIEPIVSTDTSFCLAADDFTYITQSGANAAHFEHTIVIKKNKAQKLTDFSIIEREEHKNINLTASIPTF